MHGRIVMVTGATNGIGEVTAHALAEMGATVIVVGRNEEKARHIVDTLQRETGNGNVEYMVADLSVMDEVRRLAEEFQSKYNRLHVLVNNAGMLFTNRETTPDGYEKTFALNHLNYFLLTNLLLDTIKASGTPERHARIVNVASNVHSGGKFDERNLQSAKGIFNGLGAYSNSKLFNVMFTFELARRLKEDAANVTANTLHPGVVRTGFGKNNGGISGLMAKLVMLVMSPFAISPKEGAETQIYLATSPEVEGVSGEYFDKKQVKRAATQAHDQAAQRRLWAISAEMVGLKEQSMA